MKPISCKEAINYVLRKEENKLSFLEQLSLWRHMVICNLCRLFALQNGRINAIMKSRQTNQFTLSEEEKEKIIRDVLDEGKK